MHSVSRRPDQHIGYHAPPIASRDREPSCRHWLHLRSISIASGRPSAPALSRTRTRTRCRCHGRKRALVHPTPPCLFFFLLSLRPDAENNYDVFGHGRILQHKMAGPCRFFFLSPLLEHMISFITAQLSQLVFCESISLSSVHSYLLHKLHDSVLLAIPSRLARSRGGQEKSKSI